MPPGKSTRHVLRVIREILTYSKNNKAIVTNAGAALAFLGKVQRRSSICFLISDGITPEYSHEAAIIAKLHELILITVTDAYDCKVPISHSLVLLKDLETGVEVEVPSSSFLGINKQLQNHVDQRLQAKKNIDESIGGRVYNY